MAAIIRLDVDRPYGRQPLVRHVASRVASDFFLPRLPFLGYLRELGVFLAMLTQARVRAHVFFRGCTLPSPPIIDALAAGGHRPGLHLEDSRSYETFHREHSRLVQHTGSWIAAVSKHGSGVKKYGRTHYAPYEPARYVEWALRSGLRVFFGNLKDPAVPPALHAGRLHCFPSAFWLEPQWRDTRRYPLEWLLDYARDHDVVVLAHPENVLADANLAEALVRIVTNLDTKVIE